MRKHSGLLFMILLAFWTVLTGAVNWELTLVGAVTALLTVWFWQDLGPRLPRLPSARGLLRLGYALVLMVGWVIQANITVAKVLLFSRPAAKPIFLLMEPNLRTNWGRVLFATCITITPGSVTVDVDPETGRFIVHALNHEIGIDLLYWRLIDEIIALENTLADRTTLEARKGEKHGMVTGGTDCLGASGSVAGHHRPHRS
ncbi:MAG: Na+/H+ antiporter subunit E [Firmicutes bacterium]|nr:Na+/H+ antiporter subunit E [Bacillota bacterium]